MIEGLCEFTVRDFATTNENDAAHKTGGRTIKRKGGASVAGTGAGRSFSACHVGMGESRGHAVIFKTSGGIHTFVLKEKIAVVDTNILSNMIRLPEQGLPFANGENRGFGSERKKFVEAPNATERQRLMSKRPLGFEIF